MENIKVYFENIQQTIAETIRNANSSIKIALAYFNDKELFEILNQKALKGIQVDLIISSEESSYINNVYDLINFVKSGGNCLVVSTNAAGLMHHKFCIIDESILITGSYNWTVKAATRNFENIIVFYDQALIQDYLNEFERLKKISESKFDFYTGLQSINELLRISFSPSSNSTINACDLKTGFKAVDSISGKIKSSSLNVIAARPSIGSTSLLINIIKNLLDENCNIALFSLDMPSLAIVDRLIAVNSNLIPLNRLFNRELHEDEWKQLDASLKNIINKNLYIDDTPDLTLKELELAIIKQSQTIKIDLICIDYIELLRIDKKLDNTNKFQRDTELELIIKELKRISKVTGIPILLVSHLNRSSENKNPTKAPLLSEIPNYIEQFSDLLIILHRLDKYGIPTYEDGTSSKGFIDISISRNRYGSTGTCKIKINESSLKISDYQESHWNESNDLVIGSKMNEPFE